MENILAGKKNAREPLITHNLRLVVYIAKKFESSTACGGSDLHRDHRPHQSHQYL